jgi:hypothetical protein
MTYQKHIVFALIAGALLAFPLTNHIAHLLWGDNPYSDAGAIWTVNESGHARMGGYADIIVRLAFGFSLMLAAIPAGAFISKRGYSGTLVALAFVSIGTFAAGYYWWRSIYVYSLGFPEILSEPGSDDFRVIRAGYASLSSSLACVALTSGAVTFASALVLRFRSRRTHAEFPQAA